MWISLIGLVLAQDSGQCDSGGCLDDGGLNLLQSEHFLSREEVEDPATAKVLKDAATTLDQAAESIGQALDKVVDAEKAVAAAPAPAATPPATPPATPAGAAGGWGVKEGYIGARGGINCPGGFSFYGIPQENIGGCGKRYLQGSFKTKAEATAIATQACSAEPSCKAFSCREFQG